MTAQEKIQRAYMVSVRQLVDADDAFSVSYVPRGVQQVRTSGKSNKVPEYRATVNTANAHAPVSWSAHLEDSEISEEDLSSDARHRSLLARDWLRMLRSLIETVEGYAKDLSWSTKRIDKPMEDSQIGKYAAPALLMQDGTTKFLLEPITRSAPGTEGVVDLYLMPGYDDIASLYHYSKRWNLHHVYSGQKGIANVRDAEAKPLTKANLRKVLEEMKAHAQ
jgi:hypothetical protein